MYARKLGEKDAAKNKRSQAMLVRKLAESGMSTQFVYEE